MRLFSSFINVTSKEYDILPHVTGEAEDDTGHFVKRSDTALAICSCTIPIFYKDLIRKPLGMLKSGKSESINCVTVYSS